MSGREACASTCGHDAPASGTWGRAAAWPAKPAQRRCTDDPALHLGRFASFVERCGGDAGGGAGSGPGSVLGSGLGLGLGSSWGAHDGEWVEVMRLPPLVGGQHRARGQAEQGGQQHHAGGQGAQGAQEAQAKHRRLEGGQGGQGGQAGQTPAPTHTSCWFWAAPGSGVFVNAGRSLRADSPEVALRR